MLKKIVLYHIIFFLSFSCSAQKHLDRKANDLFLEKISLVKYFMNSETIDIQKLNTTVSFLEDLTQIRSLDDYQYDERVIKINKYNLNDWEEWYKLNKFTMFFDTSTNRIKVKNRKFLSKDVHKEFHKYIKALEEMMNTKTYNSNEVDYLSEILESLTNIKMTFNEECLCKIPSSHTIEQWQQWYKNNKHRLYWHPQEHEIKVRSRSER